MTINYIIFTSTLLVWLFLLIANNNNLLDFFPAKAYGHGLSKDESFPIDISGRQIALEGLIKPSFLNEGDQQPTLTIRIFDKKTNETISDINLRIIVTFKNQTILDQPFHSLDGIVSANLIPVKDSITHEITSKEEPQQHISKNDLVQVSLTNPVTIKSKLLSDGGLYDIAVILEKTSKGIKIDSDQKINLFISILKTFNFVIKESEDIIINKELQIHLAKNDPVPVSLTNPVTIKSKLLSDGGLYDIAVILEKTSKGIKIDSDQKINLFISIGKTFPFVIKESGNSRSNNNNNLTLQIKTFYDEIQDFSFNEENSKVSFKMPFKWDLDYVNQILTLHEEIIVPKSYAPLSTVSSFIGTLNGMKIPTNTILIDDYSDKNNRIVHIVITTFKLKEYAKQIVEEGGNSYAIFELEPVKTV
jgi:hypothetical protein